MTDHKKYSSLVEESKLSKSFGGGCDSPYGEKGSIYDNQCHTEIKDNIKTLSRNMRKASTKEEIILWKHLRKKQLGYMFRRQFIIANKYIVDFVCLEKKLIVELDGSQHVDSNNDKIRDKELRDRGFVVLRFWNIDILQNIEGCIEKINNVLCEKQ